jgi:hypothetical protein
MTLRIYRTGNAEGFETQFLAMRHDLYNQEPITRGEWQSQQISMPMLEMLHVVMEMPMPTMQTVAAEVTGARMPWAEDHFLERVGGEPLNPSPSEQWWPFRKKSADGDTNKDHKSEGAAFSHTYPERMWPKKAAPDEGLSDAGSGIHHGIRFAYGDLRDVVKQLHKAPLTRQAYLPIWFPEDTGAVHGKRVPCTLGYHFIITPEGKLDVSYFMRSTDLLRHFQDDVYMAIRLAQWVADEFNLLSMTAAAKEYSETGAYTYREDQDKLEVGTLVFHTANMHIFEGDKPMIDFWKANNRSWF